MNHHKSPKPHSAQSNARLLHQQNEVVPVPPVGPTADAYRIVGYTHGLIGASKPGCDILKPHYDSGLKWPDTNNPLPTDPLWGAGVRGGTKWDGTFYRDMIRYPAGGEHFWSSYFKPGSLPGIKLGYWFNFGSGWSHLVSDDPAQILAGASQRLAWNMGVGRWELVIEATMFVTYAVVNVWTGIKQGGNDPTGSYVRLSGCDPLPTLSVEVAE